MLTRAAIDGASPPVPGHNQGECPCWPLCPRGTLMRQGRRDSGPAQLCPRPPPFPVYLWDTSVLGEGMFQLSSPPSWAGSGSGVEATWRSVPKPQVGASANSGEKLVQARSQPIVWSLCLTLRLEGRTDGHLWAPKHSPESTQMGAPWRVSQPGPTDWFWL